jgi:hypothetical protein
MRVLRIVLRVPDGLRLTLLLSGLVSMLLFAPASAHAEFTRSYVVSWYYDANFYKDESSCPNGLNLSAAEFYRRDLLRLGHPKEKVEELMKDFPGEGGAPQPWIPFVTTRGNGKDNIYANPTTMPDPGFKLAGGRYSYGFNLDGREKPRDFEEPETGEHGVDNQLYRVQGCIRSLRGVPPPGRPGLAEIKWDVLRSLIPALLISVTTPTETPREGDEAIITIDRAFEPITRDASGVNAQAGLTYRVDPNPRGHNVLRAKVLRGGAVVSTEPANVNIVADSYIVDIFRFQKSRVRIEPQTDSGIRAMIGGYLPWYTMYNSYGFQGYIDEYAASVEVPALYHALKKNADANPDPVTGENRDISAAYKIEAVPAFVIPAASMKTAQSR